MRNGSIRLDVHGYNVLDVLGCQYIDGGEKNPLKQIPS